jgi:hypothetical protein
MGGQMTVDIATLQIRIDSTDTQNATRNLDQMNNSGSRAEQSTNSLTGAAKKLADVLKMVAGAAVAIKLYESIKEATLLASRYNELGIVMGVLARNSGIGSSQISQTEVALRKTGISAIQSRDAIAKLISANIDLSKATELARLAQDAAVIGGTNSSEAFERLIKGIQSAEKETLETMGLNVNFQKSYEDLAKSLKKSAKDLTTLEKTQAATNAVMEKAPAIAGTYEASLGNAGKQMRSMARYVEDLKVQLGQPFQNPFDELITNSTKALKYILDHAGLIRSVMESVVASILPAMKIASAYFAIFIAGPAIITAVAAAFTPLIHALALYTMNVMIGQTQTIYFNRTLFGTSVSALLAAGSLTKLALAIKTLFAAFVGWEIGTYLDKEFQSVRLSTHALIDMMLVGWENMKYGALMAFQAVEFGWSKTVSTMKAAWGGHLVAVAAGLKLIGATDTAQTVKDYADGLLSAAASQKTFAEQTKGITTAHERELEIIDMTTKGLLAKELATTGVKLATAGADAATANKKVEQIKLTEEQIKAYEAAVKSAKEYIAQMQIEASEIGKSEDQVKMMSAARAAAKAPTAALRLEIMQGALALDIETKAFAASEATKKSMADATQALADSRAAEYAAIAGEVQANNEAILTYGMSKSAVEALTLARMEDRLARRGPQDLNLDEAEVNHLMRMIGLQKEKAATAITLDVLDTGSNVAKAKELLDILTAVDAATKSAADGMAASFGKVGSAIGGLTTALSGYAVQQQAIAAQLATVKADPKNSAEKIAKAEIAAAHESAQAKIRSYGDMSGAAKGFFKENTAGYRAMEGAEKAYRAVEMAMAIESMVKKLFTVSAVTTATVGGEAAKAAAVQAGVATQLAADTVKGTSAAAVAVATQAQGDPYSAWVRMAAMAAVMAALGFAVGGSGGGGGGGQTAADVQKAQGTGSVFGDSGAKSDSVRRSIEQLQANSDLLIPINQGMLTSLQSIQASMSGLTNLVVRTAGLTDGANMGIRTGTISKSTGASIASGAAVGAAAGSYFGPMGTAIGAIGGAIIGGLKSIWGKTTQNIVDSGLQYGGSVRGLQGGKGFDQYASVDTTKSSWFGLSKSTSNSIQTQGLNDELSQQFGLIFTGLDKSLQAASVAMGGSVADVAKVLDGLKLESSKVSLKGLTGTALTDALNSVVSKSMDEISQAVFPQFDKFRSVGEGYAETVMRIAGNYAKLDSILASTGTTFGLTGMASIAARERLIELTGGIDKLASQSTSFATNFLTEAERLAPVQKYVTEQLAALGYAGLNTRDDFKAAVLGLANSGALATKAGAETYAGLLGLADAFAKTTAATDDLTMSQQAIADQAKDLQTQLNELTKSETALLAIQRAGIADVNKALFDQVQAAKAVVSAKDALGKAYDREAAAAQTALDKSKSWVATLNGLNPSLALGGQSTLTPEQKYAEARAQFEKTLAAANAGDTTAQSGLSAAEQAFLTASQVVNASDARYAADYARVLAANDEALKWASAQVNVQQASLDALKAQVSGLITINDSVLTVAQAIANLHAAMGTATGMGVQFDGSHAGGLANVPFDGYAAELHRGEVVVDAQAASAMRRYFGGAPSQGGGNTDALVAEIKGLREEVEGLRADQDKQTGALIRGTGEANDKAAKTVVAGVEKSTKSSAWEKQVEYSK